MFHRLSTKDSYNHLDSDPRELPDSVLVRHAGQDDHAGVWLLARLDDQRMPTAPYLVAEVSGQMVAAISLSTGAVVADPFRRTADATDLLRMRAAQLAEQDRHAARQTGQPALNPAAA